MTRQIPERVPEQTPERILSYLHETPPLPLADLPPGQGIYALYDHTGAPRYIGITTMGLWRRIHDYHAGGDGNSHKFSTVYNAGRMFHTRKDSRTDAVDGRISKELRRLFARAHCRAVGFEIPGKSKRELLDIESHVRRIAPPETTLWNDARALPASEPEALVDALLDQLGWSTDKLAAIDRQACRWGAVTGPS